MIRNLAIATATFAAIAGFAVAQEAQPTTPGAPDINAQAAQAQAQARAQAKPGEQYEWSVDSATTHVPVHPTVVEKTTTTNVAPPPQVVQHHSQTTTTTTQGGDQ
jgi:hypothetical protein